MVVASLRLRGIGLGFNLYAKSACSPRQSSASSY